MNFHTDDWIMERVQEHYDEVLAMFPEYQVVGVFLQGSQNYGLDYEGSDIDTKAILVPSLDDIIFNRKPISTTHVRENNEHIDLKDIRLMFQTFRKQNLNFIEILFTPYCVVNPQYLVSWIDLVNKSEDVARYNPYAAVKTMKGICLEKYHAFDHPYPSKLDILEEKGYDPKQLHHEIRVVEFLQRFIAGESYRECLQSMMPEYLKSVKTGRYDLETAKLLREAFKDIMEEVTNNFFQEMKNESNRDVDMLLDDIQSDIMTLAISTELYERKYLNERV